MSDINNNQKNTVGVENITSGNDLVVNSDGSVNSQDYATYKADAKQLYWASYAFNLTNAGEKMAMYFRNPSGSGKIVKVIDITAALTNTVSSMAIVRLYSNPTVSANGTAQSARPAYIGGSQAAAVGLITSGPTVSVNGSQYLAEQVAGGSSGNSNVIDISGCIILAANNSLLLTGDPDGTNRNLLITITWTES